MKIIMPFFILLFSIAGYSQVIQGEIIYETKVDLHRNIPDEMSGMKDRIPPYRTNKQILLFNQEESMFKEYKDPKDAEQAPPPGNRRGFRFRNNNSQNELYRDLKAGTSINSQEFFGKKFLINGETTDLKWKMTGQTKQVGDYFCQKATFQDSMQNIVVWFSPMIPVTAGPNNYGGLPGMILYVNINDGERIITAVEINQKEITAGTIEKPTEGKEITKEEFEKIREEKMKEMQEEFGGDGQRRRFFRNGGE
jgi:GLPGLI family protein